MKQNSFEIVEAKEYVEFRPDSDKNALVFANKKVTAKFKSGKFRYKVAPLIVSKGHVEVDLHTVDIEIGIAFSTRTLSDGNIVPEVASVDVKCDIDRHDIKIHLFGNLLTDFASLFEIFFKGPIADELEKTIRATLTTVVPLTTNAVIDKLDGVIPFPLAKHWMIDWQTAENFQITDSWVGGGFRGLFFQSLLGKEIPADIVPNMPLKDTSHPEKF